MSMTRYSRMKPSGEDWIGDIPQPWSAIRGKMLFEIRKRIAGEDGHSVLSITQRGVEEKDISSGEGQLAADYSNYQHLHRGEFAMNQMDLLTGWVDISKFDGVTSPDYRVFALRKPNAHEPRFHLYTLQHCYSQRIFFAFGKGAAQLGRWRLPTGAFNEFRFPNPPLNEQKAIARFLDRETAKIDELIAEQEDLIRLLKEKRQVVISHAVTKGLDPNTPLKPSGIEWLGDIPVHWNRVQLGRVCTKVSDGPHFSPKYVDDGVMFISARNIRIDGWSLHDAKYVSEEDCAEFDKRVVPARGDVLYTKGGTTGVARVVDFDDRFQVWVHVAVLKIDQEIADPFFIAYALNSTGGYEQSQLHTRGATNKDLGLTRMTQIWITCPDLREQRKIVGHLNRRTAQLDRLSVEAARTIDLLKERRAALISAAVTGKIDVRGEVELPEDEAIPA